VPDFSALPSARQTFYQLCDLADVFPPTPCHIICIGTGLALPKSAPGLGDPSPPDVKHAFAKGNAAFLLRVSRGALPCTLT
jgi:hypothetical protein